MTGTTQAVALTLAVAALVAGCSSAQHSRDPGSPSASTSANQSTPPVGNTSSAPPPNPRKVARAELSKLADQLPDGAVSIAVRDEDSGKQFVFGAHHGMWTASVYKLLVLEALLMQRQDDGEWFSSGELDEIDRMIEQSDNVAGYELYLDAGGNSGLAAAAQRLGMRHTKMGVSDPTFTTTSGADALKLLECLVRPGPLEQRSRRFVLGLMRSVEADQRWGVGVVADPDTGVANKNGWLSVDDGNGPGEDDGGLWAVNSVGVVRVHGRELLVSVFTQHDQDFADGVQLVQRLARIAVPAVLPPS
jgi:beta-lactamase class A